VTSRGATVLFDLDGCLVDSRPAIAAGINHALEVSGLAPRAEADLHRFVGPPLVTAFRELLAEAGADPAGAPACVAAYRQVYGPISLERTSVVAGMAGVLERLAAEHRIAVVTSKPAEFARPIIGAVGLDRWVEAVFAPALDALDEPKAVSLARALAWSGLPAAAVPTSARMVGDRHHDIDAGRACGVPTVGVTWGTGDRAELVAAGADRIVETPAELGKLLLSR
jgi:phosphoglycolate phosphatase